MTTGKQPNQLIHSSSPYLLQHAYNPVDWHPWNAETLNKAISENKMMLVSIGYSACHWCHVMEHESFEDEEVARIMNENFICIKVDREERPDIDMVYMSAVQIMTGRGGWPLNCFTLPDGKPIYGGTYFPKQQWKNILSQLASMYQNEKGKLEQYATELTRGIAQMEALIPEKNETEFSPEVMQLSVQNWKKRFDNEEGGRSGAPKFPMPNNYIFLLRYARLSKDDDILQHVNLTLKKMAYGGIYDQVGGGFARYSTDSFWKVPHFEKMLYDNAQLISLYSEAYRCSHNPLYRDVIYQTIEFVMRELMGEHGNFYSALDADSEGVEGKFYIWSKEELKEIAGDEFPLLETCFNINENGLWEHERYILLRTEDDEQLAARMGMDVPELKRRVNQLRSLLNAHRENRVRPGLDDKSLASWNALMVCALLDAYDAFGENHFLQAAQKSMDFIFSKMVRDDGGLNRNYKNGVSNINGYLDDYAFLIHAAIRMFQSTFDSQWLQSAGQLTQYTLDHFSDSSTGMFYYTSDIDPPLIARNHETQDNVIPASNSQMALNLFYMGYYLENESWKMRSRKMALTMKGYLTEYGSAYSNWGILWLHFSTPFREVVICGDEALKLRNNFTSASYYPDILLSGCLQKETIPATEGRLVEGSTLGYVCKDHACSLPVNNLDALVKLLQ